MDVVSHDLRLAQSFYHKTPPPVLLVTGYETRADPSTHLLEGVDTGQSNGKKEVGWTETSYTSTAHLAVLHIPTSEQGDRFIAM